MYIWVQVPFFISCVSVNFWIIIFTCTGVWYWPEIIFLSVSSTSELDLFFFIFILVFIIFMFMFIVGVFIVGDDGDDIYMLWCWSTRPLCSFLWRVFCWVDERIKHHFHLCDKVSTPHPFFLKIDIFGAGITFSTDLVFTFNHFNFALFDKFTGLAFLLHDPSRVILFLFLLFFLFRSAFG